MMMVHTFHKTFVSPNENYLSTQKILKTPMTQSDDEVVTVTLTFDILVHISYIFSCYGGHLCHVIVI